MSRIFISHIRKSIFNFKYNALIPIIFVPKENDYLQSWEIFDYPDTGLCNQHRAEEQQCSTGRQRLQM